MQRRISSWVYRVAVPDKDALMSSLSSSQIWKDCKMQTKPNYLICLVCVLCTALTGATNAEIVGWWRFDEGAGTVAGDLSRYNNDVTFNGSGGTWQLSGGWSIKEDLSIQLGEFQTQNNNMTISGSVVIGSSGTMVAGFSTIQVKENWSNNGGSFNYGSSTIQFNSTTDDQWISSTNGFGAGDFYSLTINNSGVGKEVGMTSDVELASGGTFQITR